VSDVRARSFDAPRERPVPSVLRGRTLSGKAFATQLRGLVLVAAVKPNCDGCRDFVGGDLHELVGVRVVVVSATRSEEWQDARERVVIAPEFMAELEIRSAPYYVLVDPARSKVLAEGALFSPAQVAREIATHVTP